MRAITREQLRMNLDGELRRCRDDMEPLLVVERDEDDDVVIMTLRDYESLMETIRIYQNPALHDKILRGMKQLSDL